MKDCRFCREAIHPQATVCPNCRRNQPGRFRSFWRGLGWIAAAVVLLFVGAVFIGSRLDFHGKNHDLYAAMEIYHLAISRAEADALVDQIAKENRVSHSRAQQAAVFLARSNVPAKVWPKAVQFAVRLVDLKRRGIIPKEAVCRPPPSFAVDCGTAYRQPNIVSPFRSGHDA
jgi:hypothetical protein